VNAHDLREVHLFGNLGRYADSSVYLVKPRGVKSLVLASATAIDGSGGESRGFGRNCLESKPGTARH
jgi:hypothetical protein